MRTALLAVALAACPAEPDATAPSDSAPTDTPPTPAPVWSASLGPVAVLTSPNGAVLHSHATFEYDDGDHILMAFAAGVQPNVTPLAGLFTEDGTPIGELFELSSSGDKPDVAWDGSRWVVGWNDGVGRVFLAEVDRKGGLALPKQLYDTTLSDLEADAVDLAVHPDGTGVAIWSEFCGFETPDGCGVFMGPEDGFIRFMAFDADLDPSDVAHEADNSSKKASDADVLPNNGWVGVWARDTEAPTGQTLFEVWGRQYRSDGTLWTFRADDLDSALPSRPAVAAREDGVFAVVWRDKDQAVGADNGAGAFARFFAADATPLGPSRQLDPGGDGDRVVADWADDLAVIAWQETDSDGVFGIEMSVIHLPTNEIVIDRLEVHEPGGDNDERPSIAIRKVGDGYHVLFTWEVIEAGTNGNGLGIRSRVVTLTPGP